MIVISLKYDNNTEIEISTTASVNNDADGLYNFMEQAINHIDYYIEALNETNTSSFIDNIRKGLNLS